MTSQLRTKILGLAILGITVLVVATTVSTLGLISNGKTIHNRGAVKTVNVGAYWNSACTNVTTDIDWGMVSPGTVSNMSFYIRNEGSVVLKLSLSTQNWNPSNAASYISLGWNREGRTLGAGNMTQATLTLNVSASINGVSDFSLDIIVSGTEQ